MFKTILTLILFNIVYGQFPNGTLLEPPVPPLCATRKIHEKRNQTGYYFSWKEQETKDMQENWLGARNWCRQRCMDSVSLQTSEKNEFIKKLLEKDKIKYIWTSGRLCDFKGCDRADLQPRRQNGWFWAADLRKLAPTNNKSENDWSHSGGLNVPQPDNHESQTGVPENCIAVLNNYYRDGIRWHDVACHHKKPFVCEESQALLKYVKYTNPQLSIE